MAPAYPGGHSEPSITGGNLSDGFWGSGYEIPGADRAPHHWLIGRLSLVVNCIGSVRSLGVSLGQNLQVSISSLTSCSGVPQRWSKQRELRLCGLCTQCLVEHLPVTWIYLTSFLRARGSFVIYLFLVDSCRGKATHHTTRNKKASQRLLRSERPMGLPWLFRG